MICYRVEQRSNNFQIFKVIQKLIGFLRQFLNIHFLPSVKDLIVSQQQHSMLYRVPTVSLH